MSPELVESVGAALEPGAARLFEILVRAAASVERIDSDWRITFPEDAGRLELYGPQKRLEPLQQTIEQHAPPSLRRLLPACAGMLFGERGDTGQVYLGHGFDGTLHALGDDALSDEAGFGYSKTLCSPIDIDLGDFYLVHPSDGRLVFQTEGTFRHVLGTTDPVEVYLRELHYELKDVRSDSAFRRTFAGAPHRTAWLADPAG